MKTTIYAVIAATFLLTTACKSIEKLVDQGRYDEAIVLATKKLAGKSKKKTRHIKALEKAFAKVNHKDLAFISFLKSEGDDSNWERIYDYAQQIQARQSRVLPFLPLISNDGYVGNFNMVNVVPILKESSNSMSDYLYRSGVALLQKAHLQKDKLLAQEAHHQFYKIGKYFDDYKDVHELLIESENLGTFHVLIKMDKSILTYVPETILQTDHLGNTWIDYHTDHVPGILMDAVSTLFLEGIDISPEREVVNHQNERKELQRWVYARDREGYLLKDTLGEVIQVKEIEIVKARITEILRTKEAIVLGKVETSDYVTGALIAQEFFSHEIHFASDACSIQGDSRAISPDARKRIDTKLLPFPEDREMIMQGMELMFDSFQRNLKHIDLLNHFEKNISFHAAVH